MYCQFKAKGRREGDIRQSKILRNPLETVFPKGLSLFAAPKQMHKSFSGVITKRTGVNLS